LPGYFYVPAGVNKVYFSLNNSNPGGKGFATPEEIGNTFLFKNNEGVAVAPTLVNTGDSAFFYLDIPSANSATFWQASKMEQYRLTFANISNIQWYARKKSCSDISFSVETVKKASGCITILKATNSNTANNWKIQDGTKSYEFNNQQIVELPAGVSPNASISLSNQSNCIITKRLSDFPDYFKSMQECASAATLPLTSMSVGVYPNPGSGVFFCRKNGEVFLAENIVVFSSTGARIASFTNANTFNISNLPSGIYFYQVLTNKTSFKGRLVKQ
jgi:hypothetical protein